tara:strand:- start:778 stop:2562 length:1785 start_codon:yes stop_codon:yes gene_type:complete
MKVPVYRSQTLRGTPQRAAQLSVRASPGALSQDSRALASFGDELARQSSSLYESVLKEQRQTALNQAESELDLQIAALKNQTLSESPSLVTSKGPKGFRARAAERLQRIANNIDDSVVVRKLNSRAKITLANAEITVNNNARLRAIEASKAAEFARIKKEELVLARPASTDISDPEKAAARLYLYGTNGEGKKVQPSIFENMAARGLIKPSAVLQLTQESQEREAIAIVRTNLVLAKSSGDSSALIGMVNDLLQGVGDYKNIDPQKAVTLANQVLSVQASLESQAETKSRSEAAQAKAALVAERQENEAKIAAQIMEWKLGKTGSNADPDIKIPNYENIVQLGRENKVSASFVLTAQSQLLDGQKIKENPEVIVEFIDQIERQTSTDPSDYNELRTEIMDSFKNEEIDAGTFAQLYNRIDQQISSTTSSTLSARNAEETFYSKRVRELFGFTEAGVKIPGFVFDDEAAQSRRSTDALVRFRQLVDQFPDTPVLNLFERIEKENIEADERALPFMAFGPEFMDTYFPMLSGAGMGSELFKEAMSPPTMDAAANAISKLENGRERVRNMEILERLRKHLAAMQNKPRVGDTKVMKE